MSEKALFPLTFIRNFLLQIDFDLGGYVDGKGFKFGIVNYRKVPIALMTVRDTTTRRSISRNGNTIFSFIYLKDHTLGYISLENKTHIVYVRVPYKDFYSSEDLINGDPLEMRRIVWYDMDNFSLNRDYFHKIPGGL